MIKELEVKRYKKLMKKMKEEANQKWEGDDRKS